VDVVKVGATNVGRISAAYDESIKTNVGAQQVERKYYDPPIPIGRGDELGVFEMGSTVIFVVERGLDLVKLGKGAAVKMGAKLGTLRDEPPKRDPKNAPTTDEAPVDQSPPNPGDDGSSR
jgi:phosphatidylserine decarboxylase precursor